MPGFWKALNWLLEYWNQEVYQIRNASIPILLFVTLIPQINIYKKKGNHERERGNEPQENIYGMNTNKKTQKKEEIVWKEEAQVLGWQGAFVVLNIVRVLPLHHMLVLCLEGGMSTAGIEPASRLLERRYCSKEGRRRPSEKPTEWV